MPHHSLFRNVPLLFNPHLGFSGFLFVLYSVILEYSLCFAPRPDDTKYVVTPRGATLATNKSWNTQNGWNESTCICFEPSIQLSLHGRVDSRELGTLHGKVTSCKPLSPSISNPLLNLLRCHSPIFWFLLEGAGKAGEGFVERQPVEFRDHIGREKWLLTISCLSRLLKTLMLSRALSPNWW